MIRGAIFDVDGTLLDSMKIWKEVGIRYLKHMGIEARPGLSEILWDMSIMEGAVYLKEAYSLPVSTEEIAKGIIEAVREFYCRDVLLKPGVFDFLKKMKIPMVIATSSDRSYLEAAFRRTGIDGFFKRIFTCEEVGAGKTSPEIYLRAAEYLELEPREVCVFEDSLYAAKTAKRAGFFVTGVFDESENEAKLREICDVFIRSFFDEKSSYDCRQ